MYQYRSIKKNINKKTKAILAVDLFGNLPNMKELKKICKKNNLYFLEDSAEALGTEYGGIKAEKNLADVSFHSFRRTKTMEKVGYY